MDTNHTRSSHRVSGRRGNFLCESSGDAVVEATILFPIMVMIFAALVLIAVYLPAQAALQRSTQFAATALATELSDTWLSFNEESMSFYWETDKNRLSNVYVKLFERKAGYISAKGQSITEKEESRSASSRAGTLTVNCSLDNKIIYKEVIVEASRVYDMPVDLSLIRFPKTFTISATSVAVVQNGDEFIRNVDIATDFAQYLIEKFELGDVGKAIGEYTGKVKSLLGW